MQNQIPCPKCGILNRPEARFCQSCGAQLPSVAQLPAAKLDTDLGKDSPKAASRTGAKTTDGTEHRPQKIGGEIKTRAEALIRKLDDRLDALLGGQPKSGQPSPVQNADGVLNSPTMARPRIPAWQPGTQIGSYFVFKAWELNRSNYYQVIAVKCPNGHPVTGVERACKQCQVKLPYYLLHETIARSLLQPGLVNKWIEVSAQGIPAVFRVFDAFQIPERRCLVMEYPHGALYRPQSESWQSLYQTHLPVTDTNLVISWCLSLGQALSRLLVHGLAPNFPTVVELLESLIILQTVIYYADLSYFEPVGLNTSQPARPDNGQQAAISHLAQLLYILGSGRYQLLSRAPGDLSDLPPMFRGIVDQARRGGFPSLGSFLTSLQALQTAASPHPPSPIPVSPPTPVSASSSPPAMRSLRQVAGYATHPGRVRKNNEDFVGKYSMGLQQTADMPEVGLYLVADGMGGHQAGEMASKEVVREVLGEVQAKVQALQAVPQIQRSTVKLDETVTPGDALISAIQNANSLLFKARQAAGSDRGTTITAALIVGELCAVANVGDSRTYRLHQGKLEQISVDHSLVAALVSSGVIKPEEVRSHPQRNSIWRSLGSGPTVEVDIFQRILTSGDRLVLCSDGLWEMVLDPEIEQILSQSPSPQLACDRLIEAANRAGGEDNISVVVVWIE